MNCELKLKIFLFQREENAAKRAKLKEEEELRKEIEKQRKL